MFWSFGSEFDETIVALMVIFCYLKCIFIAFMYFEHEKTLGNYIGESSKLKQERIQCNQPRSI